MTATADALEPLPVHGKGESLDQRARLAGAAEPLARRREEQLQRVLFLGGAIVLPLGLALIILGYWGAAHSTRIIQQVPYELSGGMLGLGLIFMGGFAYFAWWLTNILREQRQLAEKVDEQTAVLASALGRIETLLGAPAGFGGSNGATSVLVTTPMGSLVHRPDCQVVAARDDTHVVTGSTAGLKPCRICNPVI